MPYLTETQLARALTLADLTDPAYGPHCMQQLVALATGALRERWGCPVLVHRAGRVVAVADNYDALGYPPDGPARDSRYFLAEEKRLVAVLKAAHRMQLHRPAAKAA